MPARSTGCPAKDRAPYGYTHGTPVYAYIRPHAGVPRRRAGPPRRDDAPPCVKVMVPRGVRQALIWQTRRGGGARGARHGPPHYLQYPAVYVPPHETACGARNVAQTSRQWGAQRAGGGVRAARGGVRAGCGYTHVHASARAVCDASGRPTCGASDTSDAPAGCRRKSRAVPHCGSRRKGIAPHHAPHSVDDRVTNLKGVHHRAITGLTCR